MYTFELDGRKLTLAISIGTAKKIKATTGIDLVDNEPNVVFTEIWSKPYQRLEMMWEALTDKDSITREEFDDLLEGENLQAADKALWEEIGNFIKSLDVTATGVIEAMLEQMIQISGRQAEMITKIVQNADTQEKLQQLMDQATERAQEQIGKVSIESLVKYPSTQTPSQFGN